MADRPILFSAPMVRALIAGHKTMTRRIITPRPDGMADCGAPCAPGDRLWVREAWRTAQMHDQLAPRDLDRCIEPEWLATDRPLYDGRRRAAIHLPRWASRIVLDVTEVRVERVQDISETDALAEGAFRGKATGRIFMDAASMRPGGDEWATARDWYADLWDGINGAGSWATNPPVRAISFSTRYRRNGESERRRAQTGDPVPRCGSGAAGALPGEAC